MNKIHFTKSLASVKEKDIAYLTFQSKFRKNYMSKYKKKTLKR